MSVKACEQHVLFRAAGAGYAKIHKRGKALLGVPGSTTDIFRIHLQIICMCS